MEYDQDKRLGGHDAMKHPWFLINYKNGTLLNRKNLTQTLDSIKNFQAGTKLKQNIQSFFARYLLTQKEKDELTL